MPSKVIEGVEDAAQEVAADRADAVVIPTSMVIDNSGGSDDRTIRIQDIFTPTDGDETTVDRYRISVINGDTVSLNEEDLKGVKCLGSLNIIADADDSGCYVTVGYKHE